MLYLLGIVYISLGALFSLVILSFYTFSLFRNPKNEFQTQIQSKYQHRKSSAVATSCRQSASDQKDSSRTQVQQFTTCENNHIAATAQELRTKHKDPTNIPSVEQCGAIYLWGEYTRAKHLDNFWTKRAVSFGNLPPRSVIEPHINHRYEVTPFELFKLIVVSILIGPLRFIIAFAAVIMAFVVAKIATLGLNLNQRASVDWIDVNMGNQPMPKPLLKPGTWRYHMLSLVRICTRIWSFSALSMVRYKHFGRPVSAKKAPIIVSNHASVMEPAMLVPLLLASPVTKVEALSTPLAGSIMCALEAVGVNRVDARSRLMTRLEMQLRACSKDGWPQILVFPEGTTSSQDALMQFKTGAFAPGVPVQPIVIRFPFQNYDVALCDNGPQPIELLMRGLFQVYNTFEVHWLNVYNPSEAEEKDPFLYAEGVRKYMQEAAKKANIPVLMTESTFDDVQLSLHAISHKRAAQHAYVEFGHFLKAGFNLSSTVGKDYFDVFRLIDTQRRGFLSISQFVSHFGGYNSNQNDLIMPGTSLVDKKSISKSCIQNVFYARLFRLFSCVLASELPRIQYPPLSAADAMSLKVDNTPVVDRDPEHFMMTFREFMSCMATLDGRGKESVQQLQSLVLALLGTEDYEFPIHSPNSNRNSSPLKQDVYVSSRVLSTLFTSSMSGALRDEKTAAEYVVEPLILQEEKARHKDAPSAMLLVAGTDGRLVPSLDYNSVDHTHIADLDIGISEQALLVAFDKSPRLWRSIFSTLR